MAQKRGRLIVISAPSGCGKTTIVARLLERNKHLARSISYTTRPARAGEINGRDYFFISQNEFEAKKRENFFLESAEVFGCSYGTSKEFVMNHLAQGKDMILAIDVQGMKQLRNQLNQEIQKVSIFIMPPSLAELKVRLEKRRTETKQEVDNRLKIAEQEMAERSLYDFVVVNQAVDQAVKEIEELVKC